MPHFWDFFARGGGILFVIPVVVVMLIIMLFRLLRVGSKMVGGFTVEAPSFVIPRRVRGRVRSDGTEIRTVRVPDRCPNCGALITQSDIDWVGPLEAKCNYCGSGIKAQFEKV